MKIDKKHNPLRNKLPTQAWLAICIQSKHNEDNIKHQFLVERNKNICIYCYVVYVLTLQTDISDDENVLRRPT